MNFSRNFILWIVIAFLVFALFNMFQGASTQTNTQRISYSEFVSSAGTSINSVTIKSSASGSTITGTRTDGQEFQTFAPNDPSLIPQLIESGVIINAMPSDADSPSFWSMIIGWLPMIIILGVWIFFMRQMQGSSGKAMGFGKSKAKLLTERQGRVTFEDVAGIDEAKQELEEIVEFLKDPHKFQRLGGKIPKGCLLVGPPGTGKTLLARAIAGEANVPFFTISGSDFVEMFVGVGASRVRDMFEQGKKNAPCIIFIDEIDAVGRHRGAGLGGGNDEREQTLNQLLVEMDGFESSEGVILIAATNRPDVLDPALLRPGRFDRQVTVPNPDILGREKILKVHMQKVPLSPDVDAKVVARGTPGFSGADLANLVNEAALMAARAGKRVVTMSDFEYAKDKVMMGAERRSMVMTDEEKKLTAYHEAGHALVGLNTPKSDPLHKVTIIPRGRALGLTMSLPERDQYTYSRVQLESKLAMMFGGRVAEELTFGAENITTGAGNDIQQATNMARRMVTEFGFSEKLGPLRYKDNDEEIFLGHSVTQHKNTSEATAKMIDEEVRKFIDIAEKRAREILIDKADDLETLGQALLEYESLSGTDVADLLAGRGVSRPDEDETPPEGGRKSSVPKAGAKKDKPEGDIGAEPQPEA